MALEDALVPRHDLRLGLLFTLFICHSADKDNRMERTQMRGTFLPIVINLNVKEDASYLGMTYDWGFYLLFSICHSERIKTIEWKELRCEEPSYRLSSI
jgi:hypothetical protein